MESLVMKYDDRIVCFIDILAFRNKIKSTVNADGKDLVEKIKNINEVLLLARDILDVEGKVQFSKSKRTTQFSDSIVISFLVNEKSEIFYTLLDILTLIIKFVNRGILIRGGITFGKLIHNDEIIFGPAMVKAYELESQAALYPRVILDKTVIEKAKENPFKYGDSKSEEDSIMEIITVDTDDMYYIDYIKKAQPTLNNPEFDMPKYIEKLRAIINENQELDSPSIKVKTGWLINKFNKFVDSATDIKHLKQLRLDGENTLADYYSKLEKII